MIQQILFSLKAKNKKVFSYTDASVFDLKLIQKKLNQYFEINCKVVFNLTDRILGRILDVCRREIKGDSFSHFNEFLFWWQMKHIRAYRKKINNANNLLLYHLIISNKQQQICIINTQYDNYISIYQPVIIFKCYYRMVPLATCN